MSDLSWLNSHTPCNRCVRFATTVASGHATLATKRTLLLTWAGLPPAGSHQLCLAHSFDHLLGAGDQHRRHSQAELPGSFEVDEEVKPSRLLDWQVGGLGPPENPSGVDAGLAIGIRQASAVTHETARLREVNKRVNARDSIVGGQGHDLIASSD